MSGRVWWWCCVVWAAGGRAAASGRARLLVAPATFELDSTVLLNDAARADKEVGYKIRATLHLAPLWSDRHTDYFLQFQLHSPKLYLRGKHVHADFMPYDSVWDSYSDTTFYAHWSDGLIKKAFLDPSELPDVLNYKKSLLSLFQFQELDGEYNETDVSGPCRVLYETVSEQVFRKIKRSCEADGNAPVTSARRVARYTLSAESSELLALHADELLALGPAQLGLKARAWHTLRRAPGPAPPGLGPAADLQGALGALPAALRDLPLTLADEAEDDVEAEDEQELGAALKTLAGVGGGEEAGAGGDAPTAAAALLLLPPLRAANHSALLQLLQRDDMHHVLPELCRLLGLAGTGAAHAAAADFLQLHTREPLLPLAQTYLAALALAPSPSAGAVRDVLRLGERPRHPALGPAALLAAAAAAGPAGADVAQDVRDSLARGLARCVDEPCRAARLHALANLRRADTADLLLEHAERGAGGGGPGGGGPAGGAGGGGPAGGAGSAALAALGALEALPASALTFARLDRLTALALEERAPLELRAAALDLVVRRRAELPTPLARMAYVLHARGPHELRRLLWQRMAELAPRHPELSRLPSMLEPVLRGWDAQAHSGTSTVLQRDTGWAAAGWRAALGSVQLARAGLLRRGLVRLRAHHQTHDDTFDALSVEVWTRGLEAFGGGSNDVTGKAEDDAPAEEAGGGLSIAVGGMRISDISLFNGQAELLGHVWAGTASSPTSVLRAVRPLAERRGAVPLQAGLRLRAAWRAALALALDAQAQVSLWYRSGRAALELRAGLAGRASAWLRPAWGRLAARAHLEAEPRLHIAADLDFYDAVALCVRVRTDDHELRRNVTLSSEQGWRRLRVRRARGSRLAAPGRTLALGRPNDDTCRTLRAADDAPPA